MYSYQSRKLDNIDAYQCRTEIISSFFPWTISEWNKIDSGIRNSPWFRNHLLIECWPASKLWYNSHNLECVKLLTRLKITFSHLNKHWLNNDFENCITPLCTCSLEIESKSQDSFCNDITAKWLLSVNHTTKRIHHCYYNELKLSIFTDLKNVDEYLTKHSDDTLVSILLYGWTKYNYNENQFLVDLIHYCFSLFSSFTPATFIIIDGRGLFLFYKVYKML